MALSRRERRNFSWSDETYVDLNGTINRQNDRAYGPRQNGDQGGRPQNIRYGRSIKPAEMANPKAKVIRQF